MPDENLSSSEISQLIADKEKEIRSALDAKQVVDAEENALARQILDIRLKKKDLEGAISKATHNIRVLEIEKKLLEKQFWAARNAGT